MSTGRTNATMSSEDAVVVAGAAASANNPRGDRKAAKGRRRRAAAEQRRIEQQRWGKYLDEDDEDFAVVLTPSPPGSRRRARRRNDRETLNSYHVAAALEEELDPDLALSLALALSLEENQIAPQVETFRVVSAIAGSIADMTYESLVQLEDVSCVASAAVVAALPVFIKEQQLPVSKGSVSEVCVICQGDYDHGDSQVKLPCLHDFHQACGAEWLLKYSKLCPVCKHDVTEVASEAPEASV